MDLTFGCVLSQAAYGPMAGPKTIRTLAQRAEALGFHTIWFADHIVIPPDHQNFFSLRSRRGVTIRCGAAVL
jgi:alkanesulfonate monooxygenase SsuD/methylene tetrahydromethanopterin reductase-like flavin-dependent oxidoreductase (luciferase family)